MRYAWLCGALQAIVEEFETDGATLIGTSSGLFPLLTVANGTQPMAWLERDWPKCAARWRSRRLGVFFDGSGFLRDLWDGFLLDDAALRARGIVGGGRIVESLFGAAGV